MKIGTSISIVAMWFSVSLVALLGVPDPVIFILAAFASIVTLIIAVLYYASR